MKWNSILILFLFLFSSLSFFGSLGLRGQSTDELRQKLEVRDRFNLAMSLYHRKSYGLALPYFLEVLGKDSNHFFGRYYLSLTFFRIGKTDEAIREMENLIRLHGRNRNLEMKINFFSQQKFLESPTQNFNRYIWIRDYPDPESQAASLGSSLNPFTLLRKEGYRIRTPIHIRVDQNHDLMVLDFSQKFFFRLDGDGVFLGNILNDNNISTSTPKDLLTGPWAFAASGDGFWVTDFLKDNIKVLDGQGNKVAVYGSKGIGETNFLGIKGITSDENGNFYIADSGNGRIQFINQRGEWLKNIGRRGDQPGTLLNPVDVAYHPTLRQIFVLDKGNKKITVFSVEGEFLYETNPDLIALTPEGTKDYQKLHWDYPDNPSHLYTLTSKSLYRFSLQERNWEKLELNREDRPVQFISLATGEDGYLYLGNVLREKIEVYAPVEKTYVNLPVMVGSVDTQKFPIVRLDVEVKDLIGHPIKYLRSRNFTLYENNVVVPFQLLPQSQVQRIILLVEKSMVAQEKEFTIKALMEGLFDQLNDQDGVKVITYNQNGSTDQTPFSQFKLAAIEKTTQRDYTSNFTVDGALQTAINHTKGAKVKSAIAMLVFSPYDVQHFQNRYTEIVQALKNNDIPVYIFYAGPSETKSTSLFHLHNLSRQTRGKFYIFDEQSLSRFENDFNEHHNGIYTLQYLTSSDPRNQGVFRRLAVNVIYKNSQGEDVLSGYPLP